MKNHFVNQEKLAIIKEIYTLKKILNLLRVNARTFCVILVIQQKMQELRQKHNFKFQMMRTK
jgi:hypothetical protein